MYESVLGWDIGGAHLKVAEAVGTTQISRVYQVPCELWRGLDQMNFSIDFLKHRFDVSKALIAITMTGEMVDGFTSRKEGVRRIIGEVEKIFSNMKVSYFAGESGFLGAGSAKSSYLQVASANWLGSAAFVASQVGDALFLDIGSTTTDIVAVKNNRVMNEGRTDSERLYTQEMVYCGVVRTPVFALCRAAPVGNRLIPVINEYFSNAADLYNLTGELPNWADMCRTPDNRGVDDGSCAARLARTFGYDSVPEDLTMWREVAEYIREQQIQTIINACRKRLSRLGPSLEIPIIGGGAGRFLVKEIAQRLNRQYVDAASLFEFESKKKGFDPGACAPAASIACLGFQRFCR